MPTEEDVALAMCKIFQALEELHAAGLRDAGASKVRREAVHFLWELREGEKLGAHRPHSKRAWAYRQSGSKDELRYEHSIPVASFMPELRRAAGDPMAMLAALRRYVRPVIVLEEECRLLVRHGLNSKLPAGASTDDALARYSAAGIELQLR